jgi:hypothetical protein
MPRHKHTLSPESGSRRLQGVHRLTYGLLVQINVSDDRQMMTYPLKIYRLLKVALWPHYTR